MTTNATFKLYDTEFFSGVNLYLQQNVQVFNENSAGGIRLVTQALRGNFERQSFMSEIQNIIQDRDPTNMAALTPLDMAQDELISPKVNRTIGPVGKTLDTWKKIDEDPQMMSLLFGQQTAPAILRDWLHTLLVSGTTAMGTEAGMVYDVINNANLTDKTLKGAYLIRGQNLLGDKSQRLSAFVMHSGAHADLMIEQSDKANVIDQIGSTILYGGSPATLGKPVVVTDDEALIVRNPAGDGSQPDQYKVLGLTEDALVATQSEDETIMSDVPLLTGNLRMIIQGEYAFNVGVKGFAYTDTAASPDLAALGTAGNWDYRYGDVKNGPGFMILVNAAA